MWKKFNDGMGPQGMANTLTEYTEAVEEFSSSAAEFLSRVSLLTDARDAYQRAMAVSTELRQVLDTGDETLRIVMGQLEQAVNIQLSQATSDKKQADAVKVETNTSNGDKADAARA
jgi:exonuclease VII small subunit